MSLFNQTIQHSEKILLLIRHAKSDQSFFGVDFERPLNERGKADAPIMAKRMIERKIPIDAFVSSPAKRAKKTAELFAQEYKASSDSIEFISALYHPQPEIFFSVIEQLSNNLNHVAIFSHNPGITYFVNLLSTNTRIDNMPTCGIFALKIKTEKWKDFRNAAKEFFFFDYPKDGYSV